MPLDKEIYEEMLEAVQMPLLGSFAEMIGKDQRTFSELISTLLMAAAGYVIEAPLTQEERSELAISYAEYFIRVVFANNDPETLQ